MKQLSTKDLIKIHGALALMNSMILSGEYHSVGSKKKFREAIDLVK